MIDRTGGTGSAFAAGMAAGRSSGPSSAAAEAYAEATSLHLEGQRHLQAERFEAAEESFREALAVCPNHYAAMACLGLMLITRDDARAGLRLLQRVVRRVPRFAPAREGLAVALGQAEDYDGAERELLEAIRLAPDEPSTRWYLGVMQFGRGRWADAWRMFSHRHALWRWAPTPTRWDGSPLEGRRLAIVVDELGLGDEILWARFLTRLPSDGAITVEVPEPLRRLWDSSFGLPTVPLGWPPPQDWMRVPPPPEHDVWAFTADVPAALGWQGPPPAEPYLRAASAPVERWRRRLAPSADRLNVGICWAASTVTADDHRRPPWMMRGQHRSIPPDALAPLGRVPGVRWFSLQKGPAASDELPFAVERLASEIEDFADTAAIATVLDLVVSIDSSTSNLCGGLGLNSWVLLPRRSDWRWYFEGEQSPWFPSLRLFRQVEQGEWGPVVEHVAGGLERLVAERRAA